ncbi:MAG: right-handed parallel beta-helix repeat-containing protein [Planctomycetota bacterium]
MRGLPLYATLALLAVTAPPAAGQIVFVDADLTTGANDGSSWADAFQGSRGLRVALATTSSGSEIWATEGVYRAGFAGAGSAGDGFEVLFPELTLRGGFVGGETSIHERPAFDTPTTVLSGDTLGDDDGTPVSLSDNAPTVLSAETVEAFALDRVAVEGGTDVGFLARRSAVRVTRCTFRGSARGAVARDGNVGFQLRAAGTFVDCRFVGNTECGLDYSGFPPADPPVSIDRCVFEENGGNGLELANVLMPAVVVANSVVRSNGGAGVQLRSVSDGANVQLNRLTIAGNGTFGLSYVGACGICFQPRATDCILWENAGPETDSSGSLVVRDSIVQGVGAAGSASTDALFVDFAAGDLRPAPGSPAIDAGTDAPLGSEPTLLDVERGRRVWDDPAVAAGGSLAAAADVGAYERTPFIGTYGDCAAVPNSTGAVGTILARGSLRVVDGNVTLGAEALPPNQFGIFIVSRTSGITATAGGPGTLCLGGDIGRFNGAGQILASGATGAFTLPLDLVRIPQPSAFVAAAPGDTWRFQAWHREAGPSGGSSSQWTDVVALLFE